MGELGGSLLALFIQEEQFLLNQQLYHQSNCGIYLFSNEGETEVFPGGSRIWTLSWDNKSCSSRGIGVSGTTRKE
jgi:hypothetical protein